MAITERACEIAKEFMAGEYSFFEQIGSHVCVLVESKHVTVVKTVTGGYHFKQKNIIKVSFNKQEARKADGIGKLREYVEEQCSIALLLGDQS